MKYIVRCLYQDRAGGGWFALHSDGKSCTWGSSSDTKRFETEALAQAAADQVNAKEKAEGRVSPHTWHVLGIPS